jgi:hypothetical protein
MPAEIERTLSAAATEDVENRVERVTEPRSEEVLMDERLSGIDQLQKRIDALERLAGREKSIESKDQMEAERLRVDLGLPPTEERPDNTDTVASDELKRQAERELAVLKKRETEYLGVPEGGKDEPTNVELGEEFVEPKTDEEENPEKAVERRQKAAEKWTKEQIQLATEHFAATFADSENGPRAAKLLVLKLETTLASASENYVKTGNGDESAFVVSLRQTKVERPDGGEDFYVSEIMVESGTGVLEKYPEIFGKDKKPLDADETEKLQQAKTEGRAEEEEVK